MKEPKQADIIIGHNNGVYAIAPTKNGRLASLYQEVNGVPAVWVFRDLPLASEDVDSLMFLKEYVTGGVEEVGKWKTVLRKLGYIIEHGYLFVPLSNGWDCWSDGKESGLYLREGELPLIRYDGLALKEIIATTFDINK